MRLLVQGLSNREICAKMNMSESRLSIIKNSPLFKRELNKMQNATTTHLVETKATFETRIEALKPQALDVLEGIMKDETAPKRLRKDVATDIIDYSEGIKDKDKYEDGMNLFAKVALEGLKLATQKRAQEQASANGTATGGFNGNGKIIDVTPEPTTSPDSVASTSIPTPSSTLPVATAATATTTVVREKAVNE